MKALRCLTCSVYFVPFDGHEATADRYLAHDCVAGKSREELVKPEVIERSKRAHPAFRSGIA